MSEEYEWKQSWIEVPWAEGAEDYLWLLTRLLPLEDADDDG